MTALPDAATIVGLLADATRRRVVAALLLGASTPADVAAATGCGEAAVVRALQRLARVGLVEARRIDGIERLGIVEGAFEGAARAAAAPRTGPTDADPRTGVLRNFFDADGRLLTVPAQRSKRLVVLDHLAARFEPGRVYPERDVNLVLGLVHRDTAQLRRLLVDEEFLERRDGFYWRAGGTFEVDEPDEPDE